MKLISTLVLVGALLPFSFAAADHHEEEVHAMTVEHSAEFNYFNFNAYYSCSYVEGVAHKILEDLGAENIQVDCSGGLPYSNGNWVSAIFATVQETSAEKATRKAKATGVEIRLKESCDLHDTVVRAVAPSFDIRAFEKQGACWDFSGNATYKITVLR